MDAMSDGRRISIEQVVNALMVVVVAATLFMFGTLVRDRGTYASVQQPHSAIVAHIPVNAGEGLVGGIVPTAHTGQLPQSQPNIWIEDFLRYYAFEDTAPVDPDMVIRPASRAQRTHVLEANINLPTANGDVPPTLGQFVYPQRATTNF